MSSQAGAGSSGPPFRRRRSAPKRPVDLSELAAVSGRITGLTEQRDPRRRSLEVDGQFALGLDGEVVLRLGLKVGQVIDGAALVEAHALDQEKRAWDAALLALGAAPRSRSDLSRRLARTYPDEVVERVLGRLERGGWLDDREFALAYVRSKSQFGARRLLADLARKGIESGIARAAVDAILGEVDGADHARAAATRRLARMAGLDRVTAGRRLAGYLARRGFSPGEIHRVLPDLLHSLPEPERPRPQPGGGGSRMGRAMGGTSLRRRHPLRSRPDPEDD